MTAWLGLVANAGDGTVSAFRIEDDRLTRIAVSEIGPGVSTFAVDEERNLVYAGVKQPTTAIVTMKLDRATGELSELSRSTTEGSLTYLSLTPDGRKLLGASYEGGFGRVWPVADDGTLRTPGPAIHHPNLHCVVPADDGRRAYFVSLGADLVAGYTITDDAELVDETTVDAPPGSGPRHLVLSADERTAYLVTEFSGEVLRFSRDAVSGELRPLDSVSIAAPDAGLRHSEYGADPRQEHLIWGADVHLGAGEDWLWATERCVSTIATVPLPGGELGEVSEFVGTEAQPRGFSVTPDGAYVLVVGELSTAASLYRVGDEGRLTRVDQQVTGTKANWVRFVTLD